MIKPRWVIDTNVIFEGLTRAGGSSGFIIEAWLADWFDVYVSTSLAYEYTDVLGRKLSDRRWERIKPVLGTLLDRAQFVTIYFTWRPRSPDPSDDHVVDCAMNAGASVVTLNVRDFRMAEETLGLRVFTPLEAIRLLLSSEEE
jgi:predicted nucleic acid-binding protein